VARPFAAFVGGIGFGLFIDEVGKYVTSDNNYFYKPAATIIYLTVVVLVLVIHWVHGRRAPTSGELLAGAITEATGAAGGGISDSRRERALTLARRAGDMPGTPETTALLDALPPANTELGDPMTWIGDRTRRFGARFLDTKWARVTTVVILCTLAILNLLAAAATGILDLFVPEQVDNPHNVATFGQFIAALVASICVVIGIRYLRRDPHTAYAWFERGVLVDLLLTQPFTVAASQFSVVPGVVIDLLMLVVLGAARAGHDRDRAWARTPAVEPAGARV